MTEAKNTPSSSESCKSVLKENWRLITVFDWVYAQERLKEVNFEIWGTYEYIENWESKGKFTILWITDEMWVDWTVSELPDISEEYVNEMRRKPKNTTIVADFHSEEYIWILDYISKIDTSKFRKVESIWEDKKTKDTAMWLLD